MTVLEGACFFVSFRCFRSRVVYGGARGRLFWFVFLVLRGGGAVLDVMDWFDGFGEWVWIGLDWVDWGLARCPC